MTRGLETFLVIVHGYAVETDPRGTEAGGFADYVREVYDFDWDAEHPTAPLRVDRRTHHAGLQAALTRVFETGRARTPG